MRKSATIALALVVGLAMTARGRSRPEGDHDQRGALVSDIGKFNDRSFNQSQLEGLNKAKQQLGITAIPLQSNSVSDYIPNLTSAVRQNADIVISAGFLLADATATIAKRFPGMRFAITDYTVHAAPFADKTGKPLYSNVEGLTYAANESGCLVGVLAAKMAQKAGQEGRSAPSAGLRSAGRHLDRRLPLLRAEGRARDEGPDRLLAGLVAADKCKTVATNQISQGAQVLFQVAGGCGQGRSRRPTRPASGHRRRQGSVQRREARAHERRQAGVQRHLPGGPAGQGRQVPGRTDLLFNLKNGGMGVGKINPAVPCL